MALRGRGGRRRAGLDGGNGVVRVEESVLDPETRKYLEDVKEHLGRLLSENSTGLGADVDDDEEAGLVVLVRNVVKELLPRLSNVVRDPFGSRILEELVENAPGETVVAELAPALLSGGPHKVAKAAEHRCSSHVMEKVIARLGSMANEHSDAVLLALMEDFRPPCLLDVVRDPRASHVVRSTVWNLLGTSQQDNQAKTGILDVKGTGWRMPPLVTRTLSNESKQAISLLAERLIDYGDKLHEVLYEVQVSGVLQCLLRAASIVDSKLASKMIRSIAGTEYENIGDLGSDLAGSRLMEVILFIMSDEEFTEMYQKSLRGFLMPMARDAKANYVLQRCILRAGEISSPLLLGILDELEEGVGTLIDVGRAGVVLALCRACGSAKDEACAKRISRLVARAIGAIGADARELVPLLLFPSKARASRWRASVQQACEDRTEYSGPSVSTLGALLAQSQLKMKRDHSKLGEDSVSSLARNEIIWLATDGSGSRVLDAFLEGNASAAVKSRVVSALRGEVVSLAKIACAGRVVEKAYSFGTAGERKWIVEELAGAIDELREDPQARFTLDKCRVQEFLGRRERWLEKENGRESKKRVFGEFLETVEKAKPKKDSPQKKKAKKGKRTTNAPGELVDSAMASLGFPTEGKGNDQDSKHTPVENAGAEKSDITSPNECVSGLNRETSSEDRGARTAKADLKADDMEKTEVPATGGVVTKRKKKRSIEKRSKMSTIDLGKDEIPADEEDIYKEKKRRSGDKKGKRRKESLKTERDSKIELPVLGAQETVETKEIERPSLEGDVLAVKKKRSSDKKRKKRQDRAKIGGGSNADVAPLKASRKLEGKEADIPGLDEGAALEKKSKDRVRTEGGMEAESHVLGTAETEEGRKVVVSVLDDDVSPEKMTRSRDKKAKKKKGSLEIDGALKQQLPVLDSDVTVRTEKPSSDKKTKQRKEKMGKERKKGSSQTLEEGQRDPKIESYTLASEPIPKIVKKRKSKKSAKD